MNAPHPTVFKEFLRTRYSQILKSWYIFFYQIPRIPEWLCKAADWRLLRWMIDESNYDEIFTSSELKRYREAWSQPGAFTSMLNWYRALFQQGYGYDLSTDIIETPTRIIWGSQDRYLHKSMASESAQYCLNGDLKVIESATHWVHHEVPQRVNELVIDFFNKY